MRKTIIKKWAPVVGAVVVAFIVGYWLSGGRQSDHGHEGHDHGSTKAGAAAEVWTCSMHPQVRQPQQGKCPICSMDLIPLAADNDGNDDSELPRLSLSPRSAALLQLQTAPVRRQQVFSEIRMPGSLVADETRLYELSARFGGRVDDLHADYSGKVLKEGEPLLQIYSPELHSVHQELLQALRRSGVDSQATELAREKLRLLGMSESQLTEMEEAGEAFTHFAVLSRTDAVVMERMVTAGQYVVGGDVLYRVADLSRLWGEFEVFESQQMNLALGLTADITLQGTNESQRRAVIEFIDPVVDLTKRSLRVRVSIENKDGLLRPGMLASAVVQAPAAGNGEEPLVIPASAPLITGRRAVVYVQLPESDRPSFEARDVSLGGRHGDYYIVREGLSEGELVVTNGQFKIDSELQIRGRPSMMAPVEKRHEEYGEKEAVIIVSYRDHLDDSFRGDSRPFVEAYLELTEALAADNGNRTAAAVRQLQEYLHAIGAHRLGGEAHVVWMNMYQEIDMVLELMMQDSGIQAVRNNLQRLNDQVELLYRQFGGGHLPVAHLGYCPMVDGDKGGSWLQKGDSVNNPYFGAMMLRCGDVLETLE
jgi:membrane fusion protein, copper/silver efflux system